MRHFLDLQPVCFQLLWLNNFHGFPHTRELTDTELTIFQCFHWPDEKFSGHMQLLFLGLLVGFSVAAAASAAATAFNTHTSAGALTQIHNRQQDTLTHRHVRRCVP